MKRISVLLAAMLLTCQLFATTYYVSTTGNDANPGTIGSPFRNIQKLNTVMVAGDIAYIRGGTYQSTFNNASAYHLLFEDLIGTAGSRITVQNYPAETVIMDFNSVGVPTTCYVYGVLIQHCQFFTLKGVTFKNLRQVADGCGVSRGMSLTNDSMCVIENVEIYNMGGTGMVLEDSDDNLILNCDVHNVGDGLTDGGNDAWDNADGFGIDGNSNPANTIYNTSERNTFRYCRAWLCSDDGFEFFGVNGFVTVEGCWSMANGIKPWGTSNFQVTPAAMTSTDSAVWFNNSNYWSGGAGSSSGEGYKLGESFDESVQTVLIHPMRNCLAFNNRGAGYASNSLDLHGMGPVTGIHQLWNCVAYSNGNDGFSFGAGWCVTTSQRFKNCWSWNNNKGTGGADWVYDGNNSSAIANNVWSSVYQGVNYGNIFPATHATTADFVSVSSAQMYGARQADGSLPVVTYLTLLSTSDLINKGVNVGLPFCGTSPDVNWVEYCSGQVAPVCNAGVDQTITLPLNQVTVSGSSTNTILTWAWRKITGGNAVVGTQAQTTTITGLVQGVYTFELLVTDNAGLTDVDTMQVTVNAAAATAPTCNAGTTPVTITLPTNIVALTGTGASTSGNTVSYLWEFTLGTGTIANAAIASTTATLPTAGVRNIRLKVTDNVNGLTCFSTKVVTVNPAPNQNPTSIPGANQIITLPTNIVTLSGSGTDPDGTIVSYLWTQTGGIPVTITSAATASTTVTGFANIGVYTFNLRVTDNSGGIGNNTLTVTVLPAIVLPTATCNPNITITLPTATCNLVGVGTGTQVPLTYLWTKISGPVTFTLATPTATQTQFTGLVQGIYQIEYKVTDNNSNIAKDTITVTVLAAPIIPTVNAGADQTITLPTNSVSLTPTASGGTMDTYYWVKLSGVGGMFSNQNGSFINPSSANTSFSGLSAGVYSLRITVYNTDGNFAMDTIQITVNPALVLPTANAGSDVIITLPINSAALNGVGTGTGITYKWTKLSGTGGAITNDILTSTTATGLTAGTYTYEFKVTDNAANIARDTMQITVTQQAVPPTVNAGADQTLYTPTTTTTLTGSYVLSQSTVSSTTWTTSSGAIITTSSSTTTDITGLAAGTYVFTFTVVTTDGWTVSDNVTITVVELTYLPGFKGYSAVLSDGKTNLSWTYIGAILNTSFQVQKKFWWWFNTVGNVPARPTQNNYKFIDTNTSRGNNTYRIKYGNSFTQNITVKKN